MGCLLRAEHAANMAARGEAAAAPPSLGAWSASSTAPRMEAMVAVRTEEGLLEDAVSRAGVGANDAVPNRSMPRSKAAVDQMMSELEARP